MVAKHSELNTSLKMDQVWNLHIPFAALTVALYVQHIGAQAQHVEQEQKHAAEPKVCVSPEQVEPAGSITNVKRIFSPSTFGP